MWQSQITELLLSKSNLILSWTRNSFDLNANKNIKSLLESYVSNSLSALVLPNLTIQI